MFTIRTFLKQEPVLIIASAAAVISCFFVPPDPEYFHYIDWRTLALLYSLMIVVSGLRKAGLFAHLAHSLCNQAKNVRSLGIILVLLCFFSAMLITNDVALLTFVPFAIVVLGMVGHPEALIRVVVLQTAAANLGSMLTPVGNPQNLYLYTRYHYGIGSFLITALPYWLMSFALILASCLFLIPKTKADPFLGEEPGINRRRLWIYSSLFLICLLTVIRLISWPIMLGIMICSLLLLDRNTLKNADFLLLLTFVAFFIFSGNLARIDAVNQLLRKTLDGKEFLTAVLASQVISNVPAALLLSGFTDNARGLLLGVNIGGLGTPIASLASLISMKLYSHASGAQTGKYLLWFTAINVILLMLLAISVKLI